jgi:hypothetical protein
MAKHLNQEEIMELQDARRIVDTLAQGIHPVTGEVMPEDSPYNAPDIIRAMFAVSHALEGAKPPVPSVRQTPANAGKPWAGDEDDRLEKAFDSGADIKALAQELARTPFAIESRLVKLGKLPPRPGMRAPATAG